MNQIEFDFDSEATLSEAGPAGDRTVIQVGVFVTCLVDLFRPRIGFAAVKLLEQAGCQVYVPAAQACCGLTAHRQRDRRSALDSARDAIRTYEAYDKVIVIGSDCSSMLAIYPELFSKQEAWYQRAVRLSAKSEHLLPFLLRNLEQVDSPAYAGRVVVVGATDQSVAEQQALLSIISGLDVTSFLLAKERDQGWDISALRACGASVVVGDDLAMLMSLSQQLKRHGSAIEVRHLVEFLGGMRDGPAIGTRQNVLPMLSTL